MMRGPNYRILAELYVSLGQNRHNANVVADINWGSYVSVGYHKDDYRDPIS